MRRKTLRIAVFSVLWVVGLLAICGAAFYWRLSQGPVSLAFLGDTIETAINRQLPGFRITLGEAELELDTDTSTPHVRVRNLVLSDSDGQTIASAPKAGVALDPGSLIKGVVSVRSLDLIGPRVNVRRNLDGSLELGISNEVAASESEVELGPDQLSPTGEPEEDVQSGAGKQLVTGSKIMSLLDAGGETGSLAKLEEIRLSRGVLRLYDEANDATWLAPRADLAFRKTVSGFVIAAKADVASGGEPWRFESAITFRKRERNFTANLAIENLVPANVADEIYAFSQFARLTTPLAGNFQIEAEESGRLTRLEGQVFAAAGQINLPEYLANPMTIDEGSLRLLQKGSGQPFEILESSILMGASRADVKGTIAPRMAEAGRVIAYDVDLNASNVRVDAQGSVNDPVFVDKVSYKGSFAVEDQRVDIDDLVVMSGTAGVRIRGVVTGGEESPGIQAAGRLRDVNAGLLKKLWPPIMAPKTRAWINENVVSGQLTEGVFEVNFPPDSLAQSKKSNQLPSDAVTLSVNLKNVVTRYFKSLPLLEGASGKASLNKGVFDLAIDGGFASMPSGNKVALAAGSFRATDLLAEAVPGVFEFDLRAGISELMEFASLPDLKLFDRSKVNLPDIQGQARAVVGLKLPLIKNVPRDRVTITQEISLTNAGVKAIVPGVDLTEGDFAIDINPETIAVKGPAKLNGVAAKISWTKPRNGGEADIGIETTLTEKLRGRMGIKLDSYLEGDIPVKMKLNGSGPGSQIAVNADLSGVAMRVSAAGWSRPAAKGTVASFVFEDQGKDGRVIKDLKITGKGLRISGDVRLNTQNTLRVVDLQEVALSDDDKFALRMEPSDGVTKLTISGNTFDARPYIKNLVSPAKAGAGGEAPKGGDYVVDARFKSVLAHRGENLRNVRGNFSSASGRIVSARIEGNLISGQPITVTLQPVAGGREMRVVSTDGGSTLRAADFYSKIAGGDLNFYAMIANAPGSPIRNGELELKRFDVRNEAALAELDSRGKPKKSGPRAEGVSFKRLRLPFTTDSEFVRLCGVELKGNDIGGVAEGLIRKADGAIDITGTMIPAQSINGLLDDVPLIGQILTGGKGEGLFGITFAMGGTMKKPKTQINPLSALAPGFLRKAFEFQGSCGRRPQQQRLKPAAPKRSANPTQN